MASDTGSGAVSDPSSPISMRWASPDDAERCAQYHHHAWKRNFATWVDVSPDVLDATGPNLQMFVDRFAPDSGFRTVVAVDEQDRAVAHVTVRENELVHLFVEHDRHRRGLGRQLLAVGERLIARGGHEVAELHTIVGNAPAIALYESCGWTLTDETHDDTTADGTPYTEHVLRKRLGASGHVAANRALWDGDAPNWIERGRRSWSRAPHWGEMAVADAEIRALPDVADKAVVELGCGTGYVSAWCLRAGASGVVGLDNSREQLQGAQLLQQEFDLAYPLVWSDAEQLPFADDSFDVAVSEYGAALWCDPYRWIPEAARVLRPGGTLMFLAWSTLMSMVAPDFDHQRTGVELLRAQRDLHRVVFPDTDGVEFALGHGRWIELLTDNGFRVDRLIELYAPADGPERYSYYDATWARRWPPEEVWCCTYTG